MTSEQETLLGELMDKVSIRDKMGGDMWWNVLNDECCQLANKCAENGCDKNVIKEILGQGTFR